MKNLLEEAMSKVTTKILDEMEQGQSIALNGRFELYSYFNDTDEDDWGYFVLRDYGLTDNNTEWDEGFCVQYGDDDQVIFTDVLGYDDDEDFTNL